MRIGLDRAYAFKGIDAGEALALEAALNALESQGARIVEVRMPDVVGERTLTYPDRAGDH